MPKQLPYHRYSKSIKKHLTFSQYLKWCKKNNLVADEAFQANSVFKNSTGGTGRWPLNVAQEYLLNLLHGKAPSVFTFADNYKCYKSAIEEERPHDIAYFKKWGETMMVLDSWNRNETFGITDYEICICFVNNQIELPDGNYQVLNSEGNLEYVQVTNGTNTYDTLPKKLKYHLDNNVKIDLTIYTNVTQEECSQICKAVNLGVQWTAELFRNTSTSPIASYVRQLPVKHKGILTEEGCKWFTPSQLAKRYADAWFAEFFWIVDNDWKVKAIGPKKLDEMYRVGKYTEKEVKQKAKYVDYFIDDVIKKTFDPNFKDAYSYLTFRNRILLLHLFHIMLPYLKDGYVVKKEDLYPLYKSFFDAHSQLTLSKDKFTIRKSGTDVIETYQKMITGKQARNVKLCSELIKSKFDITKFMTKKGRRVVSDMEKEAIANKQGMSTPYGEKIRPDRLHTSDFSKAHGKVPYHESFDADVDDTYIITTEANQKQGGKPISLEKHD